jgi:hypothetical protein
MVVEKLHQAFQPASFLTKVSRGANQLFQLAQGYFANALERQHPIPSQLPHSHHRVRPTRILG